MIVGVARITLELPGAHSLKEKRSVVKSLLARLQNRFNVSAAEVEAQDTWGIAVIGITCTSTSARHADEMLASALRFVGNCSGMRVRRGSNVAKVTTDSVFFT